MNKILLAGLIVFFLSSCTRDEEPLPEAEFPRLAEVFTDIPVNLTDEFFVSFDPAEGANTNGFGTDDSEAFEGTTSIRINVPDPSDPDGSFIGGIFIDRGSGRNLTGFDALTFYARGSTTGTLGQVGFGTDFEENEFAVSLNGLQLSTEWRQYTIPIPDPSKLVQEKGMFIFSAGGVDIIDNIPNGNEKGWTFWLDEIRFEKLGTIAQPRPSILNGEDQVEVSFTGATSQITGFNQTFNLARGGDATTSVTSSYFEFSSSNPAVATVDNTGLITVVGQGTAIVTASLAGVQASGSKTIQSQGEFVFADPPTRAAADVISVYSDTYDDVPRQLLSNFGGQTSTLAEFTVGSNSTLNYANVNFHAIVFNGEIPTIDASQMTTLHMDILVLGDIANGASIDFNLRDIGENGMIETNVNTGGPLGDDSQIAGTVAPLVSGQWISVDFDITSGLSNDRQALGQLVFASPAQGVNNFYVDNVYFYRD